MYFDGRYVQYENGFVVGDEAATERGIDAYSFFDNESQKLIVLIAFHLNVWILNFLFLVRLIGSKDSSFFLIDFL